MRSGRPQPLPVSQIPTRMLQRSMSTQIPAPTTRPGVHVSDKFLGTVPSQSQIPSTPMCATPSCAMRLLPPTPRSTGSVQRCKPTPGNTPWRPRRSCRRCDPQRPFAIALADARGDFTDADTAAREAESRHRQADDAVKVARTAVEESGADKIVDASTDQLMNLAPEQVVSYLDALELVQDLRTAEAALNTSGHESDHLRAVSTQYHLAADAEHAALVDVAGGPDRIVTNDYVLEIAGIATDLDYAALREALARRDALRDEWSRISTESARSSTRSNTSTKAWASTPESEAHQRSLELAVADAALVEVMHSDPVRMLRRAELVERIRHLAAQLPRQDSTMSRWIQQRAAQDTTEVLARIKAEHATLDRQVPAILAAQAAASVAADADRTYCAVASELERLRRQLAHTPALRRGMRRRLADTIGETQQKVAAAQVKRIAARAEATRTTAAAEQHTAPKAQWENIVRRAGDADCHGNELAHARAAVDRAQTALQAALRHSEERRSEMQLQLNTLTDEIERRRRLTRDECAREKRVRNSAVLANETGRRTHSSRRNFSPRRVFKRQAHPSISARRRSSHESRFKAFLLSVDSVARVGTCQISLPYHRSLCRMIAR